MMNISDSLTPSDEVNFSVIVSMAFLYSFSLAFPSNPCRNIRLTLRPKILLIL